MNICDINLKCSRSAWKYFCETKGPNSIAIKGIQDTFLIHLLIFFILLEESHSNRSRDCKAIKLLICVSSNEKPICLECRFVPKACLRRHHVECECYYINPGSGTSVW